MDNLEIYNSKLKIILSEKRYYHSICVQKQAEYLAPLLGADIYKASIAGLLHDITKEWTKERHLQYIKSHDIIIDNYNLQNTGVLHSITASVFLKEEWNITDDEILSAIRWHTTGKREMSPLEKTIFVADFTSEDRRYPDYGHVKELIPDNINSAIVEGFSYGIISTIKNKKQLIPDTISGYNYYMEKLKRDRRKYII